MKRQRLIAREFAVESVLETGPLGETLLVSTRGAPSRERRVLKWLPPVLRDDLGAIAALSHPALAFPTEFHVDAASGRGFLLRPYVSGLDLPSSQRGLSPVDLLPWLVAACDSLRVLHEAEIVHGNLKSSNLLVPRSAVFARRARTPRVLLCDPATWPVQPQDQTGGPLSADIFALGGVFYFLLTRQEPRRGPDGLPVPTAKWSHNVPVDLDRLILWALHPDPKCRCPDAMAFLEALRDLTGSAAPRALPALEGVSDQPQAVNRAVEALRETTDTHAVAISGEARTGKTGVLRRIAREAELLGYRTTSMRCYPEAGPAAKVLKALTSALISKEGEGRPLRARLAALFTAREKIPPPTEPEASPHKQLLRKICELLTAAAALRPILLCVDDAHEADPLLMELLSELVGDAGSAGGGPRPRLVVAFRSEPPYRARLRPLVGVLGASRAGHVLVDLVRRDGVAERAADDLTFAHRSYLAALDVDRRDVLEALAVLGRPKKAELIARVVERTPKQVRQVLALLEEEGATRADCGLHGLRHGSSAAAIAGTLDDVTRGALHRRAAAALARGARASTEEVARHWLESDAPERGLKAAMEAARQLVRQHEDRHALRFFRGAMDLLPERSAAWRSFALEAADSHARAGEHRRAVEILARLLPAASRSADDGRLHSRLGIYLHRCGEAQRAVEHLQRGLRLLAAVRGTRGLRERLRIECELAEIAINRGEYAEAEAICRRALEQLATTGSARGDVELLRSEMVLLETQAHLHLHRFELVVARELFERSLQVGERAGAALEQSLTLNNLGILHIQENRFREAKTCYERAESISLRLGDDPGLAAIYSNLAVIHAKLGNPDEADAAVERAAFHEGRCDSARTRFLRLHSTALVDALFGRYASATAGFKEAIALGEELKDLRTVAFDLVYLAECHLHRGEARAAAQALDRAVELGPTATTTAPVRRMVEARRAALAALAQDSRGVREAVQALASLGPEDLSYLEAWNRLFVGWAQRLAGDWDAAQESLERALAFFEAAEVRCGEVHASLELAALDGDRGRGSDALARIASLRSQRSCGEGALRSPMLSALLLAYHARALIDRDPPAFKEAAAVLGEAESYLIGRRLESVETLVLTLKRRLRAASFDSPVVPFCPHPGSGKPQDELTLLESLEGAAAELVRRCEMDFGAEKSAGLRHQLRTLEERLQDVRRRAEERPRPTGKAPGMTTIVGGSRTIQEVVALIRRLAPLASPVLIRGETGSGKELVARALHAESPRREKPFVSVSSTALPGELLEAELFGFLRGSFSGAEEDRPGLLRAAAGGTFLFDDIGEMPVELQSKLVRVLDSGSVRPLGAETEIRLDVRYIFTTSQDLRALVRDRRFRSDLLFRLGGLEVRVPPLRERLEDLPLLLDHFLAQAAASNGARLLLDADAIRALEEHSWPGNVRELENLITRLAVTTSGPIQASDLRQILGQASPRALLPDSFLQSGSLLELQEILEREYIIQLYRKSGGDVEAVARALGIKARAFFDRLRRLRLRLRDLKGRPM